MWRRLQALDGGRTSTRLAVAIMTPEKILPDRSARLAGRLARIMHKSCAYIIETLM